jgi:hypothetical protein
MTTAPQHQAAARHMQQQLQLWRSWAAGEIDDATAQAAAEAVHARKAVGRGPRLPVGH